MTETVKLSTLLEREHRDIDAGIEEFRDGERVDPAPLTRALAALRRHIYLEEEFLFPGLKPAGLMAPIFVMLREHGELWQTMDRLESELASSPGEDKTVTICKELLEQLDQHNSKEEPIIYPQADTALAPETEERLRHFLDAGKIPDGWVCERAR